MRDDCRLSVVNCQLPRTIRRNARFLASRSHSAFTILELVIVLMIVGILGAAAVPTFFRTLEQQRLESAARRLKQDLEQVRQTARTKSKTESLTFTGATTYTLSADVQGLDRKNQTYAVDLSAAPYNVSDISTANLGVPAKVTFDGYGATTANGTVVMQMGGYKRVLTLNPSTGQAAITNN
jgi:prepilin-type N-terminal cleavage/methylation domain-containing protein